MGKIEISEGTQAGNRMKKVDILYNIKVINLIFYMIF